jgi:actin-related protein
MLPPGRQLGKYRIIRSLGTGGMAEVYEAEDEIFGRNVALKVLPTEFGRNSDAIQRFHREIRAAAKLNHHGIVTVYDSGTEPDGTLYYAMRLLTGGDLRRIIEEGLSPIDALLILRDVSHAFAHAHAAGLVHRDIKPENILFDEQGIPVVTDFGIAKLREGNSKVTRTGTYVGTPRYMSPEQFKGSAVDARADLYCLGVVLYEMLAGAPPFEGEELVVLMYKHLMETAPRLPPQCAWLQGLVDKLMAKDPADRPQSTEELIELIDQLISEHPEQVETSQARRPTEQGGRRAATPRSFRPGAGRISTKPPTTMDTAVSSFATQVSMDGVRLREAEQKRKAEIEAQLKAEEEARRKAIEEARLRSEWEAQRKAAEEARLQAEWEAHRKATEEVRRKAEQEARLKAAEEARLKAEQEARERAAEEARLKAELEAQRKAELEAQRKAEQAARDKAAAEARLKAELEAQRKAAEQARLKAEQEAQRKVAEQASLKAEQAAREKAAEEARLKAEQEARRKAEKEARFRAEEEAARREAEAANGPAAPGSIEFPTHAAYRDSQASPRIGQDISIAPAAADGRSLIDPVAAGGGSQQASAPVSLLARFQALPLAARAGAGGGGALLLVLILLLALRSGGSSAPAPAPPASASTATPPALVAEQINPAAAPPSPDKTAEPPPEMTPAPPPAPAAQAEPEPSGRTVTAAAAHQPPPRPAPQKQAPPAQQPVAMPLTLAAKLQPAAPQAQTPPPAPVAPPPPPQVAETPRPQSHPASAAQSPGVLDPLLLAAAREDSSRGATATAPTASSKPLPAGAPALSASTATSTSGSQLALASSAPPLSGGSDGSAKWRGSWSATTSWNKSLEGTSCDAEVTEDWSLVIRDDLSGKFTVQSSSTAKEDPACAPLKVGSTHWGGTLSASDAEPGRVSLRLRFSACFRGDCEAQRSWSEYQSQALNAGANYSAGSDSLTVELRGQTVRFTRQ